MKTIIDMRLELMYLSGEAMEQGNSKASQIFMKAYVALEELMTVEERQTEDEEHLAWMLDHTANKAELIQQLYTCLSATLVGINKPTITKGDNMKQTILDAIEYKEINMADLTDASELYETLTYDGTLYEIAEGFVDIYYYNIRQWAVDNYDWVETAIQEGLVDMENFDFHTAIQAGQRLMLEDEARDFVEEIYTEYLMKQEQHIKEVTA